MRRELAAGSVVALLALAACGGSSDDGSGGDGPDGGSTTGASDVAPLVEEYSVLGALAEVPKTDEDGVVIRTADLAEASELADVDVPADGSRAGAAPWVLTLSGRSEPDQTPSPVLVPWPASFNIDAAAPDDFAELLGFSVLDARAFVEASAPPLSFTTVVGGDDLAPSADLVEREAGIVTDRDVEDLHQDLGAPSAASPTGAPVRVAGEPGRLAFGTSTPLLRSWLGDGESLADDLSLAAVASALDAQDVVSAVLTPVQGGADPAAEPQGELADQVPEEPFDAVGIGWSAPEGEAAAHVAYHFDSADAAEAAADVLESTYRDGTSSQTRQPYSDLFTVTDLAVDGPVVTVSVTPTDEQRVGLLYDALQRRELLFVSR